MMLGECGGSCSRAGDAPHFGAKSGHLSVVSFPIVAGLGARGGQQAVQPPFNPFGCRTSC